MLFPWSRIDDTNLSIRISDFYSYFYLKNNLKGTNDNFTDFLKFYTCKSRLKNKNRNQNIRRIPAANVQETRIFLRKNLSK
jgi:hypothetical protein